MPKEKDHEKVMTIKQIINQGFTIGLKSTKGEMNAEDT